MTYIICGQWPFVVYFPYSVAGSIMHQTFWPITCVQCPNLKSEKDKAQWDPVNFKRLLKQRPRRNPSLVYLPKNGSLSEFPLMSIHFSQSNGLWRSDWFYTELNIPKPVQLKSWSSTVPMLTPLNHLKCLHDSIFFHSGRQLNWISPKWLSISCLRVTSGYGCWGIQTHSPIHLTPISHLAQSEWMPVLQKCKKKIKKKYNI